jgi:hypothetical protein
MSSPIFWEVALRNVVLVYRRVRIAAYFMLVSCNDHIPTLKTQTITPPKHRLTFTGLRGVISYNSVSECLHGGREYKSF